MTIPLRSTHDDRQGKSPTLPSHPRLPYPRIEDIHHVVPARHRTLETTRAGRNIESLCLLMREGYGTYTAFFLVDIGRWRNLRQPWPRKPRGIWEVCPWWWVALRLFMRGKCEGWTLMWLPCGDQVLPRPQEPSAICKASSPRRPLGSLCIAGG